MTKKKKTKKRQKDMKTNENELFKSFSGRNLPTKKNLRQQCLRLTLAVANDGEGDLSVGALKRGAIRRIRRPAVGKRSTEKIKLVTEKSKVGWKKKSAKENGTTMIIHRKK